MKNTIVWIVIVLVLIVAIVSSLILFFSTQNQEDRNTSEQVFCTQDAMHCPDGSYVGRVAPSCNFAACPGSNTYDNVDALNGVRIGQQIIISGVNITPLEVVSDSRCPVDVVCIQAGTVAVRVSIQEGGTSQTSTIGLNQLLPFGTKTIKLISVMPERNSKITTGMDEYRFKFEVVQNIQ